ncbi:MAG TPA: PIN domain-containing protein [Pyrinomonadaceae bacterium]|jgi:predicted nucleic acid-binding protein|nr:PIN domain-containing protein [Pyrinomonadaceae bacterium]
MPTVLVDTAAWIALVNTRDELHKQAEEVMAELRRRKVSLVTTEFVLLEVANSFCTLAWRNKSIKLINGLRLMPNLKITPATSSLLADGWQLYASRLDKEWSLTDCISIVVMQRDEIEQAFTSDHHFEQAGFAKLL